MSGHGNFGGDSDMRGNPDLCDGSDLRRIPDMQRITHVLHHMQYHMHRFCYVRRHADLCVRYHVCRPTHVRTVSDL